MDQKNLLRYFELKPIETAKVSEISEATALSSVPPEERINFHIGNPVMDDRLYSAYLRLTMGMDVTDERFGIHTPESIIGELDLKSEAAPILGLQTDLIVKSAPYSPQGGYVKSKPNFVVQFFNEWLTKNQAEPLSYDLGEKTGKREIILTSGGIYESLRVFFHSISEYLVNVPARIFVYGIRLPDHITDFPNLQFEVLGDDEAMLVRNIEESFKIKQSPSFLILGKHTKEETRRLLRNLSVRLPLFFVEVNDAPNHHSLAREARIMNRVLRFITPGVFSRRLENFSLIFVAGYPDFIKVIETMHFQLKGTPSSTEIVLLGYLLKNISFPEENSAGGITVEAEYEGHSKFHGFEPFARYVGTAEDTFNRLISEKSIRIHNTIESLAGKIGKAVSKARSFSTDLPAQAGYYHDPFAGIHALDLHNGLAENIDNDEWIGDLKRAYLTSFLNHHPEYNLKRCLVVSGSSRTALSLLGFHCGIREVIIPDLSWTYEHCFPNVYTVPLTDNFQLDTDAIRDAVEHKLAADGNWKKYGAVVINNPHNATGQIFDRNGLKELCKWLLEKKIFIIDDLSYQNVIPEDVFREISTLRQISDELAAEGYITGEDAECVITVHSMSKTDSFAGARLSVVEIRRNELFESFRKINDTVKPNLGAVFIAYLFYRNRVEAVRAYYRFRNGIFEERSRALTDAVDNLPEERNRFDIRIKPPVGSMYPRMIINDLPPGVSLDWLASGLARQGVGLIPLSTFSRTEKGFDTGRKSFRLTLGGSDGAEILSKKTRRVLIDLNRMIAEETLSYSRKEFEVKKINIKKFTTFIDHTALWDTIESRITENFDAVIRAQTGSRDEEFRRDVHRKRITDDFLPYKLSLFRQRFLEQQALANEFANLILSGNSKRLSGILDREFYKDALDRKKEAFRHRIFDRTVHPTQMYSIKTELLFENLIENLIRNRKPDASLIGNIREELAKEYFGRNVAIVSSEEPQEVILDLNAMIAAENYIRLHSDYDYETFLSFWGDWDGSNRPSGQGHSLVAFVLIENIVRQAGILQLILNTDRSVKIEPELLNEIRSLPLNNRRFTLLLSKITRLTEQLEKRYRGTLPFHLQPGRIRKFGMKLHMAQDPLTKLWHHNDRLERKMLELRIRRRQTLEYYFSLNKRIRKTLRGLIPVIVANVSNTELLIEAGLYRDLLKRFVVTPRINQNLITAQDQFAIDTTVHNLNEINEISGTYGNPGMVLALQVSMTTRPESLISLDRKLRSKREEILREKKETDIPNVWIVPLFESLDSVKDLGAYLDKVWEYTIQSRRLNQDAADRFTEIITEVFVAGSDLSQQVGQAMGMNLYQESKYDLMTWLASHNLIGAVRMKMGSGEPMQRQGGYYSYVAGKPLFIKSHSSESRFSAYLRESTKKSTDYATTPLLGVFAGGDLRTFQSNLSEKLRYLTTNERAQLLYHVRESQKFNDREITRAGEPLSETRLQFKTRGLQELERLTVGKREKLFNDFLNIYRDNFRQILYGRDEDVVGIHAISYFIGTTTPQLRDRPTARPGQGMDEGTGQRILEKIAGIIPFSKYGSLLRAIAHNQSQTVILGINQLTTGLFRALNNFSQREFAEGNTLMLISDRILPKLPVYEMLSTLRIYQDIHLTYLNKMEKAYPAGNSALIALREDIDSMRMYVPLFQKELLRRHGLDVSEFFRDDAYIPDLLPATRPDVAVLLQRDLFNTNPDTLLSQIKGTLDGSWKSDVEKLLSVPEEISVWRSKIWELLEEPVYQRVASFVELAIALYSLSTNIYHKEYLFGPGKLKVVPQFSRTSVDDTMQQFLSAAMEYLSTITESMTEVPINIIRALKEVKRIIKIEEQALAPEQQDLLRFYLLQIARITGENG
jgi:aspartate/methionine/tyrosine aminotransferase